MGGRGEESQGEEHHACKGALLVVVVLACHFVPPVFLCLWVGNVELMHACLD
jgi:hypothetical protein